MGIESAIEESIVIGSAKSSSHLIFNFLTNIPITDIITAETSITNTGIHPVRPVFMSAKISPKNADIMPRNKAVRKASLHFSSFVLMEISPFWIFFKNRGINTSPVNMPRCITQAIVENTFGSVTKVDKSVIPNEFAAEDAAVSSYVNAPKMDKRSHGNGKPRNPDNVKTPISMDIAGAIVNTELDKMVFLTVDELIFNSFALFMALVRKKTA